MYSFNYEVVFRDVDMFGHVNNAVFCSLLETARYKYFKERFAGFTAAFVVARVEVDYVRPVRLGEIIEISAWVSRLGTTSWDFDYVIQTSSVNEIALRAVSRQVWYDFAGQSKMPIPSAVREVLSREPGNPAPR
jgi:acyl-CoA thioester hydrolase